ncbi:hypothetical protein EII20_07465 [Comamonadaceae bacterium OH2545_COT-014]|nr:hypothetical protein EII20_07465 [Comamonadaceae bacterium OH2545_COT-014]
MRPVSSVFPLRLLSAAALACVLAACGGGSDDDHDHDHDHGHTHIDTAGRLAVAEAGAPKLHLFDLDSGQNEATHALAHPANAVYASPGKRYAVTVQARNNLVQFVDGGIWQEDHGDHLHDYRAGSRLLGWTIEGAGPSHFDVEWQQGKGVQAALFLDGSAKATPPQNASVRVMTDASIAAGRATAQLALDAPLHGFAEPLGNQLVTVHRSEDAGNALPNYLRVYDRQGDTYRAGNVLPTRCDGMHGSAANGSSLVAGCADGVLLVQRGANNALADQKLALPSRVSALMTHPKQPNQYIGLGNYRAAEDKPVTTRFYAIDGAAATGVEFTPEGWEEGRRLIASTFDRSGTRFFVLDTQGTLTVMQRNAGSWRTAARVSAAVPAMPSSAPWPRLAFSGARDEVYLSDPLAKQIAVVDSSSGQIKQRISLGYAPGAMAWLGITR